METGSSMTEQSEILVPFEPDWRAPQIGTVSESPKMIPAKVFGPPSGWAGLGLWSIYCVMTDGFQLGFCDEEQWEKRGRGKSTQLRCKREAQYSKESQTD